MAPHSDDAAGGRSNENQGAQDKKLGNGEIKRLQEADIDIHDLNGRKNASKYDLYKNRDGDILVKPKGGEVQEIRPGSTSTISSEHL